MFGLDNIIDLFIDNLKKLFFPEEWIELDMKFSKTEIFSILYLDKRKEITMTELVEYINVPMSTATGIVDRLVRKGYIARERSETDRRIVVLRLTDEGLRLIQNLKDLIYKYLDMILADLTDEEKQFLARIALKIVHNLENRLEPKKAETQNKTQVKKIDIE
jgi:DNA-binding MarR family transcriptional regulator